MNFLGRFDSEEEAARVRVLLSFWPTLVCCCTRNMVLNCF